MTNTVKLHNRGERLIQATKGGKTFSFRPQSVEDFPEAEAAKILNLYKGEVFDLALATEEFAGETGAIKLSEVQEENADLLKQLKAMQKKLDKAEKKKGSKAETQPDAEAEAVITSK